MAESATTKKTTPGEKKKKIDEEMYPQRAFRRACREGRLEDAKRIADTRDIRSIDVVGDDIHFKSTFMKTCTGGRLEVVKWLTARFDVKKEHVKRHECIAVRAAARKPYHHETIRWLVEYFGLDLLDVSRCQFQVLTNALLYGSAESVEWLCTKFHLPISDIADAGGFRAACHYGQLDKAKWLFSRYGSALQDHIPSLIVACDRGHLDVVEWLDGAYRLRLCDILARTMDRSPFQRACASGNFALVRWLIEHYDIRREDVIGNGCTFVGVCKKAMVDEAVWFADRFALSNDDEVVMKCRNLIQVSKKGNLEVAKWFKQRFGVTRKDVSVYGFEAFRMACRKGHLEMAKWLADEFGLSRCDAYSHNRDALEKALANGHVQVVEWLGLRFGYETDVRTDSGGKGEAITEHIYDPAHLDELLSSMMLQTELAYFPTNPKGNSNVKSIDPELMKTIFGTTWRVDRDDELDTVGIPDVPDTEAKKDGDSDSMESV